MDKQKEVFVGSDGTIEVYVDPYQLDLDKAEKGRQLTQYVRDQQENIEQSFLKIGAALSIIEKEELFKVDGVPSFRSWATENLSFSYEHATRLIRIVDDLLPVLGEVEILPVSKMKELLPMLNDGSSPEQIREAYEDIQHLPVTEAKKRIKEIRGVEDKPLTMFKLVVDSRDEYNDIDIMCYAEDGRIYKLNDKVLVIDHRDWPRFEALFSGFVEYK